MVLVLGVVGSMNAGSHTSYMVDRVLEATRDAGAQTEVIDLRESVFPLMVPGKKDFPAYKAAKAILLQADAVLLGSPDYHGSMSGAMKNFLDYFWKELAGKVFGYVCASHEKGLLPMEQMRTAIRQCYGWSLPYGIGFNGDESFDKAGQPLDDRLKSRIRGYGQDLARYGSLIHGQFKKDLADISAAGFAAHYR